MSLNFSTWSFPYRLTEQSSSSSAGITKFNGDHLDSALSISPSSSSSGTIKWAKEYDDASPSSYDYHSKDARLSREDSQVEPSVKTGRLNPNFPVLPPFQDLNQALEEHQRKEDEPSYWKWFTEPPNKPSKLNRFLSLGSNPRNYAHSHLLYEPKKLLWNENSAASPSSERTLSREMERSPVLLKMSGKVREETKTRGAGKGAMEKGVDLISKRVQALASTSASGLQKAKDAVAFGMPSVLNEGVKYPQRIGRKQGKKTLRAELGINEFRASSEAAKMII